MEATFFVASRGEATGVTCAHDLPVEPAGEPIRIHSLTWIRALPKLLGVDEGGGLEPLRDATCQSFPVFDLTPEADERIAGLSDQALEELASSWLGAPGGEDLDTDLHELCQLLAALREALRERGATDQGLYILLEEKAI